MKNTKKGFTLIELLVVISIIGILAALATVSFSSTQKQARDTQRKSDLKQYQGALESYANMHNGMYPAYPSLGVNIDNFCDWLGITGTCPNDPKYATDPTNYSQYGYQTDGTTSDASPTATQFILWAKLENTSDYWVICSSGAVFSNASKPSISNCQ